MALIKRGKNYYLRKMINGRRVNLCLHETDPRKAAKKAHDLEDAIRSSKPLAPTVGEWWVRYQKTHSARKAVDGGQKIDRLAVEKVLPGWGDRRMDTIRPTDLIEWQQRRLRAAKVNTVRKEQGVLSAFFAAAVREKLLPENPWRSLPMLSPVKRERVLTAVEQKKLLPQLSPRYALAVRTILGTGLRVSEFLALGATTHVLTEGLKVKGKGGKVRVVPLQPEVREMLKRVETKYSRVSLNDAVRLACRRAGIPDITIHDLRRTFATRCAVAGMSPFVLAKIMGHGSIRTTDQYYVHIGAADAETALNRINLGIGPTGKVLPLGGRRG